MKFERESWRKLYVAESAEHRLLSLYARGLRDYLLRLASDDGTILASTNAPGADVARAVGCEKKELKSVLAAVGDLLRVGYLKHENRRLWIAKFAAEQRDRNQRVRRHRERKRGVGLAAEVFARDVSCRYCGSLDRLTLDHVLPVSRGGEDTRENLVVACKSCNSRKKDRTPAEAGMVIH
jgi:5-methylcytosine-specific restriction endonuclease McrA